MINYTLTPIIYLGCLSFLLCSVACKSEGSVEAIPPPTAVPVAPSTGIFKEVYEGAVQFKVKTPSAEFWVDSAAGGLSRLIDREGFDWINYKREPWGIYPASAASSYRGCPNLVFGSEFNGAGHPGWTGVMCRDNGKDRIQCRTLKGPWSWTWTFVDSLAICDVNRVSETDPYWFLYEGTVAGKYAPKTTYYATDGSNPAYSQLDHFKGQEEVAQRRWFYVGRDGVDRTFYMIQATPDNLDDHYSLLGSDEQEGINSPDGMVVIGFGRAPKAKPLLRKPLTFIIGLSEGEGASMQGYIAKSSRLNSMAP